MVDAVFDSRPQLFYCSALGALHLWLCRLTVVPTGPRSTTRQQRSICLYDHQSLTGMMTHRIFVALRGIDDVSTVEVRDSRFEEAQRQVGRLRKEGSDSCKSRAFGFFSKVGRRSPH